MSKIVVKNTSVRCISLPSKVLLVPGANILDEAKYKRVEKYVEGHKDLECDSEDKLDSNDSPLHLNVKKATAIIENTHDEEVLASWLSLEKADKNRSGIIGAIEAQIATIESVLDRKDEDK